MKYWATEYVKTAELGQPPGYAGNVAFGSTLGAIPGAAMGALAGGKQHWGKGALIGGAAGAGLGALSGVLHTNDQRDALAGEQKWRMLPPEHQAQLQHLFDLTEQNVPISDEAGDALMPHYWHLKRKADSRRGLG